MSEYINTPEQLLIENGLRVEDFHLTEDRLHSAQGQETFYKRPFGSILAKIVPQLSGPVLEQLADGGWSVRKNAAAQRLQPKATWY